MSKIKLSAAYELIQEKRYDEARILLKTIDHPTATKWLERLEQIAPETSTPTAEQIAHSRRIDYFLIALATLLILIIGLAIGLRYHLVASPPQNENAVTLPTKSGTATAVGDSYASLIVGIWESGNGFTMEFGSNGTGSTTLSSGLSAIHTYTVNGRMLTITYEGNPPIVYQIISLNENSLHLDDGQVRRAFLRR